MNDLSELKMILMGISSRLERIEAVLGTTNHGLSGAPASGAKAKKPEPADFTTRQHVVMQGVVRGWTNTLLAEWMHISPITVKTHLKGAADKLGVVKRAEVAMAAAAMFAECDPDQYKLASGGLPIDWAERAEAMTDPGADEYRHLYQPVKRPT